TGSSTSSTVPRRRHHHRRPRRRRRRSTTGKGTRRNTTASTTTTAAKETEAINVQTLAGGRYRIDRPLGHGGMASVYLAHDEQLGRPVALKLLAENLSAEEALRERFVREAQLAARLSHPNVVQVFDSGEQDGRPFLVME